MPHTNSNQERLAIRAHIEPWRNWIKLARWRDLCAVVFERDGFTCQCGCGRKPVSRGDLRGGHVVWHDGNEVLFWDPSNVRTMLKECHDKSESARRKQRPRGVWY